MRQTAQHGADQENADGDVEEPLAAIDVAEFPVERRCRGGSDHEGGDHPGKVHEPAEIAHDSRQGGADDILVEGGEGERQHETGEDEIKLAAGNVGGGRGRGGHDGKKEARRVPPV